MSSTRTSAATSRARLGLTYDELKDVNPRIVCCSLSGFGMTGPRAGEGGYDYMMQGLAGWMSLTGDPDGPPTKSGLSLVDLSGGYASTIAMLAGLWRARRDGVGCDCDISLFETALHELMYIGTWAATQRLRAAAAARTPRTRRSSRSRTSATADGWIVVACPKQKFWERLCEAIGRPGARGRRPRFADFAARDENRDELLADPRRGVRERTVDEWLDVLAAAGVPSGAGERRSPRRSRSRSRGPRRHRRVRASDARHGAPGRDAAPARRRRRTPPAAARSAASTPTRCSAGLCGYAPERIRALREAGVFGEAEVPA